MRPIKNQVQNTPDFGIDKHKKIKMKKYIFMAVAAIAALSSCSKNDPIIDEPAKKALTFTATMESGATRATYDSEHKCASWEVGDQISINGVPYKAQSAGLTTTFKAATPGQEVEEGDCYEAYFACTYDGTTATLPSEVTETWAEGKFNMPMYAYSETTNLQFKNLCAVLKITVTSDWIDKVKKIRVSSANYAISGAFTVDEENNYAAVLEEPNAIANTLTVTYTEAVTTTPEGKVFYVAIPEQNHNTNNYKNLKIELSADGTSFTRSLTTSEPYSISVKRNTIYPILFFDPTQVPMGTATARIGNNDVNVKWVQLWENGPKFAEYNVGVTDGEEASFGGYYCWGGSEDKDEDQQYNDGTVVLTGENDTATKLWGNNWRMPTQEELQALMDNCDVVWTTIGQGVRGCNFTGKTALYKYVSIFLPAAGYFGESEGRLKVNKQYNYGCYWFSTPNGENKAYSLNFYSGDQFISNEQAKANGFSVRAVLKE